MGALAEKNDIETALNYIYDPDIVTVVQFAPAIRTAVGEEFGVAAGTNLEGQIITSLKRLGADVVLDTNFTADLVIMEEGSELLHRIKNGGALPMFTSCCPAWINFAEKNYPEMGAHYLHNPFTLSSVSGPWRRPTWPRRCTWTPGRCGLSPSCPAPPKKARPNGPSSAQTLDRTWMWCSPPGNSPACSNAKGSTWPLLAPTPFDNAFMADYSGAAVIFGATGGVMEAALRTVHKVVTGEELDQVELTAVRGNDYLREAEIDLGHGVGPVRVAVVHTLKAARQLIEDVQSGAASYHFVEVMSLPRRMRQWRGPAPEQARLPGLPEPAPGRALCH